MEIIALMQSDDSKEALGTLQVYKEVSKVFRGQSLMRMLLHFSEQKWKSQILQDMLSKDWFFFQQRLSVLLSQS